LFCTCSIKICFIIKIFIIKNGSFAPFGLYITKDEKITDIIAALSEHFIITDGIGIELHPDNVNIPVLKTLKIEEFKNNIN